MILYITDRNIRVYNADNQISYNSDYIAEFRFDDEWNGKVKTARFVQNGEYFDVVLADDRCKIPPLKTGFIRVGVFTDSMTSTYADVYFKTSIKDGSGNPTEPPEDVYAQLTALIESGILKGDDGLTPYVGSNNNWWIGDIDTGVLARGTDGEDGYTPVKGVDYFTEEEIQQIQNEVSGGAIGDFKAVVDEETATFNANAENTLTGYNANAQEKFETYNANANSKFSDYNTNAEEKFSKYTSNAEAKLSEYNKNDLDKTALYNTNADNKFTTYNENAEEKFSEYNSNATTKLSEYNQNDLDKTALYNANAESKLDAYDSNAQTKLSTYNSNAEQKLEVYNQNHTTKFTTYDTNAEQHTTDYNRNAAEKLEAYNQNHAAKVAEYNTNAETKTAEFDSNAAALQTEVDRLRGEKANVDGYYEEMTVGDAEQLVSTQFVDDSEPYLLRPTGGSSDVGNRAYLDKIVGGTVAWNQLVKQRASPLIANGVTSTYNTDGTVTLSGTITEIYAETYSHIDLVANHVYLYSNIILANPNNISFILQPLNLSIVRPVVKNTLNLSRTNYGISGVTSGTDLTGIKFKSNFFDLTQMFGSTIADYIYSLEQSQAGAGVAWFKNLFPKDYYEYNAGELLSVEGLQSHDTVGFNQWDEEWEVGTISRVNGTNESRNDAIRSKNPIPVLPNTSYCFKCPNAMPSNNIMLFYYGVDKNYIKSSAWYPESMNDLTKFTFVTPTNCRYIRFIHVQTQTYKNDICVNLSDPSRNGEYEKYVKHSYPLDNSLTLRGIPKLDSSNNLYYDGDEYTSDGKVKRKYGIIDLGSLNWGYQASGTSTVAPYMYTDVMSLGIKRLGYFGTTVHNIICSKYTTVARNPNAFVDKTICADGDANRVLQIQIKDSAYTDAATFKAAMSGVMLVYELATPTTETAEPYNEIQICDDFGTEEFVSTGMVPVGHNTRYPANLRDKLQHLPSLASADGTYLIQQSGKQMSLIHTPSVFPKVPTEDGTYMLKTVVTGGVATLQWVIE